MFGSASAKVDMIFHDYPMLLFGGTDSHWTGKPGFVTGNVILSTDKRWHDAKELFAG